MRVELRRDIDLNGTLDGKSVYVPGGTRGTVVKVTHKPGTFFRDASATLVVLWDEVMHGDAPTAMRVTCDARAIRLVEAYDDPDDPVLQRTPDVNGAVDP